jgi:hypothetical protein
MRTGLIARLSARLAPEQRRRLRRYARPAWLGSLRRTTPLSENWGFDRGTPIDRHYIESFLQDWRRDIRGDVLEIRDSGYTDRFGTAVAERTVLDLDPSNPQATIIADLASAETVAADQFDCFILTQTLQFIYDTRAAVGHARRILKPGGVLLATVPSISRLAPRYGLEADYWRFTTASCSRLFGEIFGDRQTTVRSYGNVLAGVAFLMGMACEELRPRDLESKDAYFPVVIGVRAIKSGNS